MPQRTTPPAHADAPPPPFHSRMLKSVKQAVFGRSIGLRSADREEGKEDVELEVGEKRGKQRKQFKGVDEGGGDVLEWKEGGVEEREEEDGVSRGADVNIGVPNGGSGRTRRRTRAGGDETMTTPILRRKRKRTEVDEDAMCTPTRRRPKMNHSNQKAEYGSGDATTTSDVRHRKGRRKEQGESESPLMKQDAEQDGAPDVTDGFPGEASPDELAPESSDAGLQHIEDVALAPIGKKRKRGRAAPASIDQDSPFVKKSKDSAVQNSPQSDTMDLLAEHTEVLHDMLEKDPEALTTLKMHILSGLTGKRRLPLMNLDSEYKKVHQLVEQTVLAGEGNSMLIIGSRGTGKTALVETVISELLVDHKDDFHVVRLNGFIHVDDKLALREIWRQLGEEMEVENEDLNGRNNYADTLTSLLALLAHPVVADEDGNEAATARSVIFVLDEFDLFASHPRQTLLYNLFDIAQSRNAPIAVLGLSTKLNVVESLEKRVKSRFSQRYVHLPLPKTFTAYQDLCLSALFYNPTPHDLLLQPSKTPSLQHLSTAWNAYASALITHPSLHPFLQSLYTSTKSLPAFLTASLLPFSTLTPSSLPTPSSYTPPNTLPSPENNLALLPSLSHLALALLIAAARLALILATDLSTFPMVYDEYATLAARAKLHSSAAGQLAQGGMRVWSLGVAKGAWEGLADAGLVVPGGREGMWRVDVGLVEVGDWIDGCGGGGGGGLTELGKWCREI